MRNKVKFKKGAALLEVIIAITVLSIIIIPISNIVINSIKTNKMSERKQIGSFEGQKLLEEFKSYDKISVDVDGNFKLSSGNEMNADIVDKDKYLGTFPFTSNNQIYELNVSMVKDTQLKNSAAGGIHTGVDYAATFSLLSDVMEISSQIGNTNTPSVDGFTGEKILLEVYATGKSIQLKNMNVDGTDGSLIKSYTNVDELDTKKILINVGSTFIKPIEFVVRNLDPGNKVNIDRVINQSVDEGTRGDINESSVGGTVEIKKIVKAISGATIGDLYNVVVNVKYKDEIIYESSVAHNIEVIK
jgi:Tfp pilus assembly protein PilV